MKSNVINIYARQKTETMENYISEQGFGSSTPLEMPKSSINYIWEGQLHGQKDGEHSHNVKNTLDELAENLVSNIRTHPSPLHNQARVPAYSIRFDVGYIFDDTTTRSLTLSEQAAFDVAFNKYLKQL